MPPKKPAKPNAFTCFVSEMMKNSRDKLSFHQAINRANPIWCEMTQEQRKPYYMMAKKEPRQQNENNDKKNCLGVKLSTVKEKTKKDDEEELEMKRSIERIVMNYKGEIEFETQKHFFIALNYFVRTTTNEHSVYVPAELSISEFSLKDGVTRKYSTYINPAVDIYGFTHDAREHANKTHMLPLPPNAMGEKNLTRIYDEIMQFVGNDRADAENLIPVYTHKDSIKMVKSALQFLAVDNWNYNFDLPVYSIQHLLLIMKEVACKIGELPMNNISPEITNAFFERDDFEYQEGISCNYHEELDRSKYCTQAMVTRWGFMFAKYICQDVAIAMVPGRHMPKRTPVVASVTTQIKLDE